MLFAIDHTSPPPQSAPSFAGEVSLGRSREQGQVEFLAGINADLVSVRQRVAARAYTERSIPLSRQSQPNRSYRPPCAVAALGMACSQYPCRWGAGCSWRLAAISVVRKCSSCTLPAMQRIGLCMKANTTESIQKKIGQEVGVSEWLQITQPMIDRFADLTDDHQFIHVDPIAAARTPFGGTVAHGFLILSTIAKFVTAADFHMQGTAMVLNYGFEKIRMVSPVKTGSRIRGRFTLKSMVERSPGQWL